jgi:hypothetical protein
MSISDAIYRPFENLIRPLDIPYRPLPPKGPVAVLLHFVSMFRGGDAAEPLYASVGFEVAGVIPDFAWDPDGKALHATTYMFRRI